MFEAHRIRSQSHGALSMLGLIYHSAVRDLRKSHRNAIIGLLMNMLQTMMMVAVFYIMFQILGLRGAAIRGDFLLYIMSGIFLFVTHTKAISAVQKAEGATSAMMKHGPMNTIVAICAAALSSLYIQVISAATVLYIYHIIMGPITILYLPGAFGMVLLAWFSGCAIGLVFNALTPWIPGVIAVISPLYQRANMIASGKMFVANTLPPFMLSMFDWNPLFHCIDQARGFAFINYNPHFSSVSYPIKVSVVLIMIGLMLDFYSRKHASSSWNAAR